MLQEGIISWLDHDLVGSWGTVLLSEGIMAWLYKGQTGFDKAACWASTEIIEAEVNFYSPWFYFKYYHSITPGAERGYFNIQQTLNFALYFIDKICFCEIASGAQPGFWTEGPGSGWKHQKGVRRCHPRKKFGKRTFNLMHYIASVAL